MNKNNPEINICMITDDNYIMPTSVAIHSMIVNKGTGKYNFLYHYLQPFRRI